MYIDTRYEKVLEKNTKRVFVDIWPSRENIFLFLCYLVHYNCKCSVSHQFLLIETFVLKKGLDWKHHFKNTLWRNTYLMIKINLKLTYFEKNCFPQKDCFRPNKRTSQKKKLYMYHGSINFPCLNILKIIFNFEPLNGMFWRLTAIL